MFATNLKIPSAIRWKALECLCWVGSGVFSHFQVFGSRRRQTNNIPFFNSVNAMPLHPTIFPIGSARVFAVGADGNVDGRKCQLRAGEHDGAILSVHY